MPDREVPGSAPYPDPGASRLDAVERLRRQLEEIESGPRDGDGPEGESRSRTVRRQGGSIRRRRSKPNAGDSPTGVWRSDDGPVPVRAPGDEGIGASELPDRPVPESARRLGSGTNRRVPHGDDGPVSGCVGAVGVESGTVESGTAVGPTRRDGEQVRGVGAGAHDRIRALQDRIDAVERGLVEADRSGHPYGPNRRAEDRRAEDREVGDSGSRALDQDAGDGRSRERRRAGAGTGGRRGSRRRSGTGRDERADAAPAGAPKAGTETQAKDVCLRLLTDRARSRTELADKLAAKGFTPEVAERALNRLAEVGLIDDAAFAEQWVHSRHTFSGKGKKVLAQELRRKGVSDTDAEPALAAITPADESARAAELVRRKLATLPGDLTPDKATARLVGMLARRGFNQSMAYAVVKDELAAADRAPVEPPEGVSSSTAAGVARTDPGRRSLTRSTVSEAPTPSTGGPDAEQAVELVRRKMRTMSRDLPRDKTIARLVGVLARRGFDQSMAYRVVKDELAAVADDAPSGERMSDTEPGADGTGRLGRASAVGTASAASAGSAPEPDAEQAAELVRRKMRTMPRNLSSDKVINRLVGMLARRGYRQSVAYDVVRAELAHGYPPE